LAHGAKSVNQSLVVRGQMPRAHTNPNRCRGFGQALGSVSGDVAMAHSPISALEPIFFGIFRQLWPRTAHGKGNRTGVPPLMPLDPKQVQAEFIAAMQHHDPAGLAAFEWPGVDPRGGTGPQASHREKLGREW
jgi:hypothetical protein